MPTITLTITLSVPEGTNFEVKTDTGVEPEVAVEVVEEEPTPEIETVTHFRGEYGTVPPPESSGRTKWSDAEDDLAQDMSISDAVLADVIGRNEQAVHSYRYHKGYSEVKYNREIIQTRRSCARWTNEETEELMRLFGIYGDQWDLIGESLGRSRASAQRRHGRISAGWLT
jgi:hypothetical protein